MSPIEKEILIVKLARAIDETPNAAALALARTVVTLVQDRKPEAARSLNADLLKLAWKWR